MSIQNRGIRQDWDVYTSDNEHVGKVRQDHADYLYVHHGRLFGQDEYYFPSNIVGRVRDEKVYLTLSQAELERGAWSSPPTAATTGTAPRPATTTTASERVETSQRSETLDQNELVVPVVEERIDVTKRPVELGEVVISREVIERRETVPVEVMHEEVRVERRSAAREATPDDLRLAAGQGLAYLDAGEAVIIPIIEEVVEVRKRLMVREELVVTKQRVSERHEVTETVRRVEPHIDSSGRLERDVDETTTARTGRTTGVETTGGMVTGTRVERADEGDRNPLERARDAATDAVDRVRNR
jgi:uncharacterized protein (TIGR02271 family)